MNESPRPKPPRTNKPSNKQKKKVKYVIANDVQNKPTETENKEDHQKTCLICCEASTYFAVYKCNHGGVCWKCCLSLRELMKDDTCCICKEKTETPILTEKQPKLYSQYNTSSMYYDEKFKIYTDSEKILDEIEDLRAPACRVCRQKKVFSNISELSEHMKKEHALHYCNICLQHRKVFLKDQKLYTFKELGIHQRFGEKDESGIIHGHPPCKFCDFRLYSDDDLFSHMLKSHEQCHICREKGIQFEFYRNYEHLESHFSKHHFLCKDEFCRKLKFIVFENELDLMAHEAKIHSGRDLSKKEKEHMIRINLFSPHRRDESQEDFERRRRQFRMGQVDASVIRFVDAPGGEYLHVSSPNIEIRDPTRKRKEKQTEKPTGWKGKAKATDTIQEQFQKAEDKGDIIERNKRLIENMKKSLNDENKFRRFREISAQFRKGEMFATEYLNIFWDLFGEKDAKKLFPELIDLLPDEQKRHALQTAYTMLTSKEFGTEPKKKSKKKSIESIQIPALKDEFPTLGKVVDLPKPPKSLNHSEQKKRKEDFPTLPLNKNAIKRVPINSAWTAKPTSQPKKQKPKPNIIQPKGIVIEKKKKKKK